MLMQLVGLAGKLWGARYHALPGRDEGLSPAELRTVQWTLKQFAMGVKAADRCTEPRSLGSYLRGAWAKVSPSRIPALWADCGCREQHQTLI